MSLTALTLTEAASLISRGEISPVELVREHLARIETLDSTLKCFITLTADAALEQARAAESDIRRGDYRGMLHGIPIGIKDLFETRGTRTTAGSRQLANYLPTEDATVVRKLSAAGAISLGKLNMHEWAMGATNINPYYGMTRNPWDVACITGGSSGGSASALSAQLCMGALGTDTGGSIRTPASLCGVVGLKPTYGRVSLRGVIPLSWSLDHAGPMARRVADVACLFQAMAGYDPADPYSLPVPADDTAIQFDGDVVGWRIALAVGAHIDQAETEVRQAVQAAASIFEQLGAVVTPVEPPLIAEARQTNPIISACDAAAFHRERLQSAPEEFGADVLARLKQGEAYAAVDYVLARRRQAEIRRTFEQFFEQYDLLLLPTNASTAFRPDDPDFERLRVTLPHFVTPFNLTGLPALSLPCGFSTRGLPIGLQIVGAPWSEARILRAAYTYEQVTPWHLRTPGGVQP